MPFAGHGVKYKVKEWVGSTRLTHDTAAYLMNFLHPAYTWHP
jgi:hypothetical protein